MYSAPRTFILWCLDVLMLSVYMWGFFRLAYIRHSNISVPWDRGVTIVVSSAPPLKFIFSYQPQRWWGSSLRWTSRDIATRNMPQKLTPYIEMSHFSNIYVITCKGSEYATICYLEDLPLYFPGETWSALYPPSLKAQVLQMLRLTLEAWWSTSLTFPLLSWSAASTIIQWVLNPHT